MEYKSIKESDRLPLCVRFCCAIISVFLIIIGIILLGDDDPHGAKSLFLGLGFGSISCSSYKGNIKIQDERIGPCSRCNTLNSSLEIYRRVTNRERRSSTITHSSDLRIHCMMCGCDMTAIEYRQENETAVTADENGMSGSEEEESAESYVLFSSFEHGAKDKSKSLFSDLANAIEKEEREKKEKKPLVSHLEIV